MTDWDLRAVTMDRPATSLDSDGPRSTQSFRVVDQIPAVLWTTDQDLVFTSSLGSRLDGLGLGPDQLVGTALADLFETDDYDDEPVQAHRRALNGESVTFQIRWVDHRYRARVAPLRDSIGQVIGTICVAFDETEVRKAARTREPRPVLASGG
jgi:PAS domain-containing protein